MVKNNIPPVEIYEKREQIGINNSLSMLTEIIDKNKEDKIRSEAIIYLGKLSTNSEVLKEQCFEFLENLLISEDNREIQCSASKALGKIRHEKALKPLKWILEQELINDEVKEAALRAIAKIRFNESEIKLFIKELNNNVQSIREFVKHQLTNLNPEEIIKYLVRALNKKSFSEDLKAEIISLIGFELSGINVSFEDSSYLKIKYPEIFKNLILNKKVLLDNITTISVSDNSELMKNILAILETLGEDIKQDLIKLLLIDDFIIKKNITKLVGKLKYAEAVDFLVTNLDNMYNEVSIASIEALGEIGDTSAVPELLSVLNIEDISFEYLDIDMKFYILDAVKNIYLNNGQRNFDQLYSYLNMDNDMIKESIAFILGEIGDKEFVKVLINLLNEKNVDVKKNSIIALGKIGHIKALSPLISVVDDDHSYWLIKKVAVDAIYNIYHKNWYLQQDGKKEAGRELVKHTAFLVDYLGHKDNENFKVKLSIIKFLEEYGDRSALSALLKRINDFHRVVRIHASNAIKRIEKKLELEEELIT